jgi:DNA primase
VLDELGITGYPKTSGGRGLHVYVRIEPRWGFAEVRRAALAFAREVERRAPDDVTTTWWRKDRDPAPLAATCTPASTTWRSRWSRC